MCDTADSATEIEEETKIDRSLVGRAISEMVSVAMLNPKQLKRARTLVDTFFLEVDDIRPTIIVLTIAHLNHTPEDCADDNLRALCQRHHLAHDRDHHRITAWTARRARLPQQELAF